MDDFSTTNSQDGQIEDDPILSPFQNLYKDYPWDIQCWSDESNEFYHKITFFERTFILGITRDNNQKLVINISIYDQIEKDESFQFKITLLHQIQYNNVSKTFKLTFSPNHNEPISVNLPIMQREIAEKGFVNEDEIKIQIQIKIPEENVFSEDYNKKKYESNDDDDINKLFGFDSFSFPSRTSSTTVYFAGLKNQGATCYMNSLLQALFHLPCFRRIVFEMDEKSDMPTASNVVYNLKLLFAQMQLQIDMNRQNNSVKKAVSTTSLTTSFGWTFENTFMQHDVQEFCRVLLSNLEEKMKGTKNENSIKFVFSGEYQTYTKGINHEFMNTINDEFYDLSLQVKDCDDIYQSFEKYVEEQMLDGDNKYNSSEFGLIEALNGIKFVRFPRVLCIHLKRFEIDTTLNKSIKINSKFEFYKKINLNRFLVKKNQNQNQSQSQNNKSMEVIEVSDDSDDVLEIESDEEKSIKKDKYSFISQEKISKKSNENQDVNQDENNQDLNNHGENDGEFDLYGVLVHSGSSYSGHFYAYLRPNLGDKWYQFNDSTVSEVSEEEAIAKNFGSESTSYSAYMLIYTKESERKDIFKAVENDTIPPEIIDAYFQLLEKEKEEESRLSIFSNEEQSTMNIYLHSEKTTLIPNSRKNRLSFQFRDKDGISFSIGKSMSKRNLYSKVSELYSKPVEDIELWQFNSFGFDYDIKNNDDALSQLFVNKLNLFVFTNLKKKDEKNLFANKKFFSSDSGTIINSIFDEESMRAQKIDYIDEYNDFEMYEPFQTNEEENSPFNFLDQTDIPIFVYSYCPLNSPIFTYLYSMIVDKNDSVINTITTETKEVFLRNTNNNENGEINIEIVVYRLDDKKLNRIKKNDDTFNTLNCSKGSIFVIESRSQEFIDLIHATMKVNGYDDSVLEADENNDEIESNDVIEMSFNDVNFGDENSSKVINFLDVISTENFNASQYFHFLNDMNLIEVCSVNENKRIKYPNSIQFGEFCRFLCAIFNCGSFIILFKEDQNRMIIEDDDTLMFSVISPHDKKINAIFIEKSFVNDQKEIKIRDAFVPFVNIVRLLVDVSLDAVSKSMSTELLLPDYFMISDIPNILTERGIIGGFEPETTRVLQIKNRRIQRILNLDDKLDYISDHVRIEKVPADQIGIENIPMIKIAFSKEIDHEPFLLPIKKDDLTILEIKEQIRIAINENEDDFSEFKTKFCSENGFEIMEKIDNQTIINQIEPKIAEILFSKPKKIQSIFGKIDQSVQIFN